MSREILLYVNNTTHLQICGWILKHTWNLLPWCCIFVFFCFSFNKELWLECFYRLVVPCFSWADITQTLTSHCLWISTSKLDKLVCLIHVLSPNRTKLNLIKLRLQTRRGFSSSKIKVQKQRCVPNGARILQALIWLLNYDSKKKKKTYGWNVHMVLTSTAQ